MSIYQSDGALIWEYDGEKLRIEGWGENSLRVRATRRYQMNLENWALLSASKKSEIAFENGGGEIRNGKIRAEITKHGKLTFWNQNGEKLLEEYVRNHDDLTQFSSSLNIKARELRPTLGGGYRLTMRFESEKKERIYGMGQYQHDIFNLKGATLELAQRNSQASVPFYISDIGYGFLWNNPAVGRVTFGTNITEWCCESSDQLDYWVTAGDTPAEIHRNYMKVTGTPPMMPDFAMGFWQCKLRYRTQEELLSVAREYKRRGLPLSVIVLDYFHWPNQGVWDFDRDYFPDPKAMVDELKEMGVELMVSIWPTVDERSPNYDEMKEKGYLVQTDRGFRAQMDFKGNEVFFDATNPDAREYVWNKVKKNYFNLGIRMFWLDVAEPEYYNYDFDLYRYALGTDMEIGNIYPFCYTKGFYDGMIEAGVESPINLVRCAWAGSQRYGALLWSGDIDSSFQSLRNQVVAGMNMAIAGIPWWTTDIGGFHGGNPEDPAFRECLIRWFQYGVFCPVFRLHGDRQPTIPPVSDQLGGGMCESGADNEVWSFGEEAYPILVSCMKLRERLRPYIKTVMEEAHCVGAPVIRPLFYEFPQDKNAWLVEDQYLFGSDILVNPVLEAGQRQRTVYLPKGEHWIDTTNGKIYAGGQQIECYAPLENIPVFVRAQRSDLLSILKNE